MNRNLGLIKSNLEIADAFVLRHKNTIVWKKPLAGTISFPELRIKENIHEFCLDLIDRKGVMLLPSDVYDYDKKCVRIGFGRKNFPETISLFDDYLTELNY